MTFPVSSVEGESKAAKFDELRRSAVFADTIFESIRETLVELIGKSDVVVSSEGGPLCKVNDIPLCVM